MKAKKVPLSHFFASTNCRDFACYLAYKKTQQDKLQNKKYKLQNKK